VKSGEWRVAVANSSLFTLHSSLKIIVFGRNEQKKRKNI